MLSSDISAVQTDISFDMMSTTSFLHHAFAKQVWFKIPCFVDSSTAT